jgi:hypothetical protein
VGRGSAVARNAGWCVSVASSVKCRIEPLELSASVVGGELPVNLGVDLIATGLPGVDFAAQGVNVVDAAIQALGNHHVEFDLSHVEPAAVLGRVDELEAIP